MIKRNLIRRIDVTNEDDSPRVIVWRGERGLTHYYRTYHATDATLKRLRRFTWPRTDPKRNRHHMTIDLEAARRNAPGWFQLEAEVMIPLDGVDGVVVAWPVSVSYAGIVRIETATTCNGRLVPRTFEGQLSILERQSYYRESRPGVLWRDIVWRCGDGCLLRISSNDYQWCDAVVFARNEKGEEIELVLNHLGYHSEVSKTLNAMWLAEPATYLGVCEEAPE